MNRGMVVVIFALFVIMPFISAIDTDVTIHTVPDYQVMIRFLSSSNTNSIIGDSIYKTADSEGNINFVFTASQSDFHIKMWLRKDGTVIMNYAPDDVFPAGGSLEFELYPIWYTVPETSAQENLTEEEIANETADEQILNTSESDSPDTTTSKETEKPKKETKATAFIISKDSISISTKMIFYAGIGIVALLMIIFGTKIIRKKLKNRRPRQIIVKKLSELKEEQNQELKEQEKSIKEYEEKIKKAKEKMNEIKNSDKIDEIKKKIIENEKELIRLRRESAEENKKE